MKIKAGSRRLVLIFDRFVIKLPKPTSWLAFVLGVLENLHERYWWCADGIVGDPKEWYNSCTRHLAQIYWADRFGLMVIMEKVRVLRDIPEEADEFEKAGNFLLDHYKGLSLVEDIKPENIGIREDGRVVLVDYGYFHTTQQWYLGRKVVERRG
jgi:serine/threonine protein kinase